MSFLIISASAYTISRLGEQGLADFCGLKTLRHGTDPLSWARMHIIGATPERDGGLLTNNEQHKSPRLILLGATNDYKVTFPKVELNETHLYFLPKVISRMVLEYQKGILESVYTKLILKTVKNFLPILEIGPIMYLFKKTLMYSLVTLQKCTSTFNRLSNHQQSRQEKILFICASVLAGLTPTLKIRKRDFSNLENPSLVNVVLLTKEKIPFYDIGIIGVFKNGLQNMCGIPPLLKEPILVCKGAVKLTLTAGLIIAAGSLAPHFIAVHSTAILAGAIFGAI